jgi:hypothetical protein
MKRREFLGYTALGAVGAASAALLGGCDNGEPKVKFWQHGNFRPVTEEVAVTDLKVQGQIPPELNGLYVRNGTNTSRGVAEHFFGGDGMLHGVRLENGQAKWYRNRYVNTPLYRDEGGGFGSTNGEDTTSAVSLIHHGGRLMSLGEFGYPYLINPDDLSTLGAFNYDGKLTGNMTAHPRIDPVTGELSVLRLQRDGALPDLHARRRSRQPRAGGTDHADRAQHGPRFRRDGALRRLHGDAGAFLLARGDQRQRPALQVGWKRAHPGRCNAAHRERRRHQVVRYPALLRVPHHEFLRARRRRDRGCRPL